MPSPRVVDLRACVARCSPDELLEAVADPVTRAKLAAALAGAVEEPPSLAEALDEDVERVAAELAPLRITAVTDAESKELAAQPSEAVHDALAAAFGRPVEHIEEALLGADAVPPGESFDEWGIEVSSTVACGPTLSLAATRGGRTGRGSACASGRPRRRSRTWSQTCSSSTPTSRQSGS